MRSLMLAIGSLVLILLACSNSAISAQETPVRTGDRVRVTHSHSQTTTGTLLALDQQILTLDVSGSSGIQIRRSAVTKLEVSRGQRSKTVAGALIGAGAGFVVGTLIVAAGLSSNDNVSRDTNKTGIALAGGALGAGAGLLIGGIIGASKKDLWEEVPLDGLRVGLASLQRGRLNFRVSYRVGFGP